MYRHEQDFVSCIFLKRTQLIKTGYTTCITPKIANVQLTVSQYRQHEHHATTMESPVIHVRRPPLHFRVPRLLRKTMLHFNARSTCSPCKQNINRLYFNLRFSCRALACITDKLPPNYIKLTSLPAANEAWPLSRRANERFPAATARARSGIFTAARSRVQVMQTTQRKLLANAFVRGSHNPRAKREFSN